MTIFIDENILFLEDALKNCGEIIRFKGRQLTQKELIEKRCDFLFVRSSTKVDSELLENTNVRFVGSATSGTDHIDLEYLKNKGIKFSDAKGSNANSVAEYVIYSILKWAQINKNNLKDKKIGIIGYGNIGKLVAKYSNLLGLDVCINDPPLLEEGLLASNSYKYSVLEQIFQDCDIITIHVPLTKGCKYPTYKMIDNELLNLMKKDSLFIHTSRGGVVDESALLEKLTRNKFFAVIDVWENEPLVNSLLCRLSFMATPHIAGYSYDGKLKGMKMMADFFSQVTELTPDYSYIEEELKRDKPTEIIDYNNHSQILEILERQRKFLDDHINFLKTMLHNDTVRGYYFDELRKNYPKRREVLK